MTQKARIAHLAGPTATIQNTPPLITSNKARAKHGLPPMTGVDGTPLEYDALRGQRLAAPATVYVEQFSAHPLESDTSELYGPPDGYMGADGQFSRSAANLTGTALKQEFKYDLGFGRDLTVVVKHKLQFPVVSSKFDSAWADNGPGWIAVRLADAEAVLALQPNLTARSTYKIGVVGLHPPGTDATIEVRALFKMGDGPGAEDPVTGSLNAAVAQWLLGDGTVSSPYVAVQGTAIGRHGRVSVREADGEIWVGGAAVTCIDGEVDR